MLERGCTRGNPFFFFSSRRRHTRWTGDWSSDVCSSDLGGKGLKIESRLNGKVMQSDNTNNMMFPVAETLADVSQAMTLEPGDLLVTGTPSGVGHARKRSEERRVGNECRSRRAPEP